LNYLDAARDSNVQPVEIIKSPPPTRQFAARNPRAAQGTPPAHGIQFCACGQGELPRPAKLGRTALEPKAALGAKPESMFVWLRHRVPALNWMLRGLLGAVTHAEAPERTPFKSSTAD
jgi:hypothetical protein